MQTETNWKHRLFYLPNVPRGVLKFFIIMWLIMGLIFTALSAVPLLKHFSLQKRCTLTVTAVPVNVDSEERTGGTGDGGHIRNKYYSVDYRIEVNGNSYDISHEYTERSIKNSHPDDYYMQPVSVKVDPDSPTDVLWGDESTVMPAIMLIIGIAVIIGSGLMYAVNIKAMKK